MGQVQERKSDEGELLDAGEELGAGEGLGEEPELDVELVVGLVLAPAPAPMVADHLQCSWSRIQSHPPSSTCSRFRRHKSLCMA